MMSNVIQSSSPFASFLSFTPVATSQAGVKIRDGRGAGPRMAWWHHLGEQTLKHKPVPVTVLLHQPPAISGFRNELSRQMIEHEVSDDLRNYSCKA